MIAVRVTTACGKSWVSSMNATLEEAINHFMGYRFEELVPDKKSWAGVREHLLQPVIKVEQL